MTQEKTILRGSDKQESKRRKFMYGDFLGFMDTSPVRKERLFEIRAAFSVRLVLYVGQKSRVMFESTAPYDGQWF
jgi:hypothetical protein